MAKKNDRAGAFVESHVFVVDYKLK